VRVMSVSPMRVKFCTGIQACEGIQGIAPPNDEEREEIPVGNGAPLAYSPSSVNPALSAPMPNNALNRRKVAFVGVLIAILFAIIWVVYRASVHPEFGRIYVADMSESYKDTLTLWEKARVTVNKWIHPRQRRPPNPYRDLGLEVGPAVLGWGSHANSPSERNGYIYMRNPLPSGGNQPLWEFALTPKRRLSEVTREDLRCEYYGMDDPRGTNVFGAAWSGAAILVPEGQVFLGRLVTNRSVIYIIRLGRQRGPASSRGAIRIEYVVATTQPADERR
jgi:hypothetical protein